MKIEQQVTSLEISKRLKELGVKQESYFFYNFWEKDKPVIATKELIDTNSGQSFSISAFTVAELGEVLPFEIQGKLLQVSKCVDKTWVVYYEDNVIGGIVNKNLFIEDQGSITEADARGKMLIYLLENNLTPLSSATFIKDNL